MFWRKCVFCLVCGCSVITVNQLIAIFLVEDVIHWHSECIYEKCFFLMFSVGVGFMLRL